MLPSLKIIFITLPVTRGDNKAQKSSFWIMASAEYHYATGPPKNAPRVNPGSTVELQELIIYFVHFLVFICTKF